VENVSQNYLLTSKMLGLHLILCPRETVCPSIEVSFTDEA